MDIVEIEINEPSHQFEGAFLTWSDLYVTARDVHTTNKSGRSKILEGLTGYAEPGKVLAIMGPSGSGKSTLLDALAGRLLSNMKQSGEILINGRNQVLAFGTSAYVTQDDILMTTLTIREAVYYSALLQLPETMSKTEKLERADNAIKMMGLENAMDTMIGGRTTAGISGGQRRRVSICMEILTRPQLLFLDEPTSGLDSAASYHVMRNIINLVRHEHTTVVASIHQPSSDVFELFHNLCLLSYGKLVYFGHTSAANSFFTTNGFPCPSMRNPSDHYLRTINNDFESEEEGIKSTEKAINILCELYKSSHEYSNVQMQVCSMRGNKGARLERRSQAKFVTQCIVLTKRSTMNMYRDQGYYKLRLVMYIVICICIGTIYHKLGNSYSSIQARALLFGFVSSFLTFMSIGGFPSFVEDMKIFGRERLNGHYGVSAFVISNTISSIPFLIIISVIPGALAYYISGLQKGFDKFVYFILMLYTGMSLVESLMMMIASIVPDYLMGITTGAGIQGLVFLTSGCLRLPGDLPQFFWKYPLYYIMYGAYVYEGLLKNEFDGLSFTGNNQTGGVFTSEDVLRDILYVQVNYSKWVNLLVLLAMVVIFRLIFFWMIKIAEIRPVQNGLRRNQSKS
ncbi:ABC transporter G family member 1-like [Silene latifolia]|uniref:ABC transporter G family member 1-like n=1 Tax=Silene latifolia TaxID=37657 RepID=UPI003D77986E